MAESAEKDKLDEAIECLLGSWPLLRGVVATRWREYDHRKLKELRDYYGLDASELRLHTLSNAEIERLFCRELRRQIDSFKMKPSQIEDFLRVFMDEVFDAVPDETTNQTSRLAEAIYLVRKELKQNKLELYEQARLLRGSAQSLVFVPSRGHSESEGEKSECSEGESGEDPSRMTIERDTESLKQLSSRLTDEGPWH